MSRDSDNPCLQAFEAALKGKMDDESVQSSFEDLEKTFASIPDDLISLARERLLRKSEEIVDNKKNLDEAKRFRFLNMLRQQAKDFDKGEALKDQTRFKKETGLEILGSAIINGTVRGIKGGKDSLFLNLQSAQNREMRFLWGDLARGGELDAFNAKLKENDGKLLQEMLDAKLDPSKPADTMGAIIWERLSQLDQGMKRVGLFHRDRMHRITANFHDRNKLLQTSDSIKEQLADRGLTDKEKREKSFNRWWRFTTPLLNPRVLGDLNKAEEEEVMRGVYKNLTNKGSRFVDTTKSIQKRLEERQFFQWKDAESGAKYNQVMGHGTMHAAIMNEIKINARRIATVARMGDNPDAYMDNIVAGVLADPERFGEQEFTSATKFAIKATLDQALGRLDDPASSLSKIGQNIRSSMRIAQLGNLIVASVPDVALITLAARRFYSGFLGASAGIFKSYFEVAKAEEVPWMKDFLRTAITSEVGQMGRLWEPGMNTGALANAERVANKLNGMQWWDQGWRKTLATMTVRHLWSIRDQSFEDIIGADAKFGEDNVRILKSHDIEEREWNAFRKNSVTLDDRHQYLIPESAMRIEDGAIDDILRAEGRRGFISDGDRLIRRELIRNKIDNYVHEVMDSGILRPDAQVHGLLNGGLSAARGWGQVLRMFTMYKSWGLMWAKKGLGEMMYGRGANSFSDAIIRGKADLAGMAQLLMYATSLGYLSLTLKGFTKGLSPPDPSKPRVIIDSLLQGGAPFASFGDSFLKNNVGWGRSVVDSALGPVARNINDTIGGIVNGVQGKNVTSSVVDLLRGNLWGANLPGVGLALQSFLFESMQEHAHPGSIARHKALLLKETGQQSFIN